MKITDMLDSYHDESIRLPEPEAPSAERTLSLTREKLGLARKRRRIPVGALAAAAAVLLFSVTAGAFYISHEHTVDLIETGPFTGGNLSVEVDDTSKSVIEAVSQDYGMTVTDSGATVSLDSIMGFHSERLSVAYFTLTLTPPEDTELTADPADCGFWQWSPSFDDLTFTGGGTCTTVDNQDGTISVMLMYTWFADVNDLPLTLSLEGFGNVSKEAASGLYDGTRTIEVPGVWEFQLSSLNLDAAEVLSFDPALFDGTGILPTEITYSAFGGMVATENPADGGLSAYADQLDAICPDLEIDWSQMTLEQLNVLFAAGDPFTDEQIEEIQALLDTAEVSAAELSSVQVRYPDGTLYDGTVNVWKNMDDSGQVLTAFLFEAPQDLESAEALILNGVEVPLP